MTYDIEFTDLAQKDIAALKKSEPKTFKKLEKLLAELIEHPETGTGKPELLCGDKVGLWSRRITKKHRLVYKVFEKEITILVLSACRHYDDK